MRLPRLRRHAPATSAEPPLRTVQVVQGSAAEVAELVAVLERAGCVVESVVAVQDGWEITARSHD